MIQLYNSDCIKKLSKIETDPSKTVIITSPPYNMNLRVRKDKYVKREFENSTSELIATKYKNYRDDLPMDVYFNWQKDFLNLSLEKADLVFYNIQMITGNKVALFNLLGEFCDKIKEVIIWDKMRGQPAVQVGVMNSRFEFILVLSGNTAMRRAFADPQFDRGTLDNLWQVRPGIHKGMKAGWPEELIEKIVKNFVPQDYLVIDPFMGSGTAGVICKRNKINFIGIEKDKETFLQAVERIKNEPKPN